MEMILTRSTISTSEKIQCYLLEYDAFEDSVPATPRQLSESGAVPEPSALSRSKNHLHWPAAVCKHNAEVEMKAAAHFICWSKTMDLVRVQSGREAAEIVST